MLIVEMVIGVYNPEYIGFMCLFNIGIALGIMVSGLYNLNRL